MFRFDASRNENTGGEIERERERERERGGQRKGAKIEKSRKCVVGEGGSTGRKDRRMKMTPSLCTSELIKPEVSVCVCEDGSIIGVVVPV